MANPTWPASLPQQPFTPDDGGPSFDAIDNSIRTTVAAGPPKMRRRFTAVYEPVTVTVKMDESQLATLNTFIATTLQDVLPFDWIDFAKSDGTAATYRFLKRPAKQWYADDLWLVTMNLEKLP